VREVGYLVEFAGGVAVDGGGLKEQSLSLVLNHPTQLVGRLVDELVGVVHLLFE